MLLKPATKSVQMASLCTRDIRRLQKSLMGKIMTKSVRKVIGSRMVLLTHEVCYDVEQV